MPFVEVASPRTTAVRGGIVGPMADVPKPTAAGRRRVEAAFAAGELLLVQGQAEVTSVADLLAGRPVTTRGYSWDYVPAWEVSWELAQRPDVVKVKLVRGRNSLVGRRHWEALEALARPAREGVLAGRLGDGPRALLAAVEAEPGRSGEALKGALGLAGKAGTRAFQRHKAALERSLVVVGRHQDEAEHHTHDSLWFPWREGEVARALRRRKRLPSPDAAADGLFAVMELGDDRPPGARTVLPVLAAVG